MYDEDDLLRLELAEELYGGSPMHDDPYDEQLDDALRPSNERRRERDKEWMADLPEDDEGDW